MRTVNSYQRSAGQSKDLRSRSAETNHVGFLARSAGAAGTSARAASWALLVAGLCSGALAAQAQTVLIRNATVLTITKGTIENGSVLVQDGKITAVGKNLSAPAGATVVDGTGKFVTPGLIDCHSHTAVEGSVNEGSLSDSSMVNIADVLNPSDINIYRALAGGLTVSNVLHGSANSIGGQTIVIKLRWGKPAKDLIFEGAKPGIKFALGENPKRAGQPPDFFSATTQERRYPGTRLGVEDEIREDFTQAKIYQAKWKQYNERVARGDHPIPPRRDLRLEPLVEVLEGKRYVHAHSYRADEILALIRTADDMGFKIRTFQHVLEGYKVADEIAAHGAGASTFSDWYGYKYEVIDATPYNAAIMTRKGIVVSLNSDSDELQRHLNWDAAKVIRYGGLTPDEALAMVTINPAKQLGIDDKVGSIEVGKSGDLVLYDKHPLSNYAKVLAVWIDGHQYFDRDQDLKDRDKLAARKKELIEKEKADEEAARRRNAAPEGRRPPGGTPPKEGEKPNTRQSAPQNGADQAKEGAL
jgi:imidazolonepropionase-like amidohydrolase